MWWNRSYVEMTLTLRWFLLVSSLSFRVFQKSLRFYVMGSPWTRSPGNFFQLLWSMQKFSIEALHVSLYLSNGLPATLLPSDCSPNSTCFRKRSLSILLTCPSHRSLLLPSVTIIDGNCARWSTSIFVIFSCHVIFSILWNQRRWKILSLLSCLE